MRSFKIFTAVFLIIGILSASMLVSALPKAEESKYGSLEYTEQVPQIVVQIAEFHLSKVPAYENCQIKAYYPVYNAAGDMIMYYEAKVVDTNGNSKGYIMLSSDRHDYPIVEFTTQGVTNNELFSTKVTDEFKVVRFGPGYIAAQDASGKLLAEEGNRPIIMTAEIKAALYQSSGEERFIAADHKDNIALTETIQNELLEQLIGDTELNTDDYYLSLQGSFEEQFLPSDIEAVNEMWEAYNKEMTENTTQWPWTYHEYWADGTYTHFSQIPPNTSPNNKGYYTGCGATAWMNLYGAFDVSSWESDLLEGTQYYNNTYIKNLTVQLSNLLGTWHSFNDMGATWPWKMQKGVNFADDTLNHNSSYWYRYGGWPTGIYVYPVVKSAIKDNDTPCIVGYISDVHYEIADGIYQSSVSPYLNTSWVHVRMGNGKWIGQSDIFGAWTVYDFY